MHPAIPTPYSTRALRRENRVFQDSGGVSRNNRAHGFLPAFLDRASGRIYRACFANGSPAPMHLLDGLPDELVEARNAQGRVVAVSASVEAGFLHEDCFYSRQQAAQLLA